MNINRIVFMLLVICIAEMMAAENLQSQPTIPARCYGIVQYVNGQFVGAGKTVKVKSKWSADSVQTTTYVNNDTTWYLADYPKTDTVKFYIEGDTSYYYPNSGDSLFRFVQSGKWELANLKKANTGIQAVTLSLFCYQTTETGINLFWRAESQRDSYSWKIYRSSASEEHLLLTTIPAEGNTNEPKEYGYFDCFTGSAKYSLTEVDIYGKETALDSLIIKNIPEAGVKKRLLAQNPFRQKAVITAGQVSIYDIAGRRVASLESRNNVINWETKNIPAGVYLFMGKVNDKRVIEKGVLVR